MTETSLALEGYGTVEGRQRSSGGAYGEAVFTTAYTGYEESITDPSYSGQILIFSYPLIGNYGVREERFESGSPQVEGVVAREMTDEVAEWLQNHDVPAIDHVDTRDLVLHIRDNGAAEAAINPNDPMWAVEHCPDFTESRDYILAKTNRSQQVQIGTGEPHIAFIDCGAKQSIIDEFLAREATLTRFSHEATENQIRYADPDLIFISNGPGDPEWFEDVQHIVSTFAGEVPMAGICLGQQVIALALGGETEKMKFGHHGINQPVIDLDAEHVAMTTQNHGYEVADPGKLDVTHRNVNDDSTEGLASEELGIITRQYHPEARPGPHDSLDFFEDVLALARGEHATLS